MSAANLFAPSRLSPLSPSKLRVEGASHRQSDPCYNAARTKRGRIEPANPRMCTHKIHSAATDLPRRIMPPPPRVVRAMDCVPKGSLTPLLYQPLPPVSHHSIFTTPYGHAICVSCTQGKGTIVKSDRVIEREGARG